MIIKKIKSSMRRRGAETADYLRDAKNAQPGEAFGPKAATAAHGAINCLSDDWESAAREIAVAERAYEGDGNAVSHWVLSWPEGERPTPAQERQAWEIFLRHQGMEGHPLVFSGHDDTGCYHSHGLVSRLKPEPDADGRYRIQHFGGSETKLGEMDGSGTMRSCPATEPLPRFASCKAGILL